MMRVLHLPTTVGGTSSGLSRHLRMLGIDSQVWAVGQNYFEYPVDRVLTDASDGTFARLVKMLRAGAYVFGGWDAVHFNYGSTLFSTWHTRSDRTGPARFLEAALNVASAVLQRIELAVLRARHIPVFVHYLGDDARQGDYSLEHFDVSIATQVPPGYYRPQTDRWKRRQIALMTARSSAVYAANPDLLNVLPPKSTFLPYGHVAVEEWTPRYTQAEHDVLVFAHAPSHRKVKGTDLIVTALSELEAEGYRFTLDLIEGVSNSAALKRYEAADVMIDQLYAGWYGGVAVEAMALGKPVVVYLRESDFRHLPTEMAQELPLLRATPMTVKEDLRAILETPRERLLARARESRAFVEKWHDPVKIASMVAEDYRKGQESLGHESHK
jgi:hypothetical protein